jgi:hypothetical protein
MHSSHSYDFLKEVPHIVGFVSKYHQLNPFLSFCKLTPLPHSDHLINYSPSSFQTPSHLIDWIDLRVSVALSSRLAQNLMHTRSSFLLSIVKIATVHAHDSKLTRVKTANFIHLRETWHADSLNMVVLPSTGAWR